MITLSERLQMVADQMLSGGVVADIGCDHGFTSIYLVSSGKAQGAIAMDVNEGPLQRAARHIKECGLEKQIALRLSDGTASLERLDGEDSARTSPGNSNGKRTGAVTAVRSVSGQAMSA